MQRTDIIILYLLTLTQVYKRDCPLYSGQAPLALFNALICCCALLGGEASMHNDNLDLNTKYCLKKDPLISVSG